MFAMFAFPRVNADGSRRTPRASRGDWYRARGPQSQVELKFYTAPPSEGHGIQILGKVWPHSFLGPVHEVSYEHPDFVTVLVPVPWEPTLLGWLNVWSGARGGVDYAIRVCDGEVATWVLRGWTNLFLN